MTNIKLTRILTVKQEMCQEDISEGLLEHQESCVDHINIELKPKENQNDRST